MASGDVAFDAGLSREQLQLAAEARRQGIQRVLLCVGGGGRSTHFAAVAADKTKRKRLISALLALCIEFQLSGVDLDWEGPASAAEWKSYEDLISQLHHAFSQHSLLVTVSTRSRAQEKKGKGKGKGK